MKAGWETSTLEAEIDLLAGFAFKSAQYTNADGGVRLLRGDNIVQGCLRWDDVKKWPADDTETYQQYQLRDGDVVLAMDRPWVKAGLKHAMITADDLPCLLVQRTARLRTGTNLDNRFLMYLIGSDAFTRHTLGVQTGIGVPHISGQQIKDFQFTRPPLSEQRRIVGILDEAFEGLATANANAEQNLQNARALFESHLQAVFTQRGDGWVEKRLEQVCSFSSGGTPSKENSSYWNGDIPWVSGRDMKSTRLSDAALHISKKALEESSTRMAPAGALLTLVRGMGLAHGAQIAELMVPCAFNQDIRAILPDRDIVPRYLLFALRLRIDGSDHVLSNAAHGTLKIDMDELRNVKVRLPPTEHQHRIVRGIDALSEETQRLESLYQRKLAALDELKKSLLHRAFSGQL